MKPLKKIFLILCFILIAFNAFQLFRTLAPKRPINFSGLKFSGLGDILKNETLIGYVSDLDLKETKPLAEYEQAQYMLAPIILDIQKPFHKFVIINCSNDNAALAKLKELNARPLLRNQFGVILATTELAELAKKSPTESARP